MNNSDFSVSLCTSVDESTLHALLDSCSCTVDAHSVNVKCYCTKCTAAEVFFEPMFNQVDSDEDIETHSSTVEGISDPMELFFQPVDEYPENAFVLNNPHIDPDINYYNCVKVCTSNYVCADEISTRFDQSQQSFSVLHVNCRSLQNKVSEIDVLLSMVQPTIVALTETWLDIDTASTIHMPGYKFVYRCRANGEGGGGVGFLIKNDTDFQLMDAEWVLPKSGTYESLFVKIKQKLGKSQIVGVIYRPPNEGLDLFNQELDILLSQLSRSNHEIFLAGDYNIDLLKVKTHLPTRTFFNTLTSHRFLPTILRPTRITKDTATLIDNVFTNTLSDCIDSAIIIDDISDHLPIYTQTKITSLPRNKASTQEKRQINEITKNAFNNLLLTADWSEVFKACDRGDPTVAYTIFIEKYKSLYETSFPKIKFLPKKRQEIKQPWMTKALLKSCIKKSRLYKKYMKAPTQENKTKFVTYRNKF
jgi:hypothetical protein